MYSSTVTRFVTKLVSLPLRVTMLRVARCVNTLEGHLAGLTDLLFDRCGGVLATTSEDHTAKVWDTETGLLIHALPPLHRCATQTLEPKDARTLVSRMATVWDTETGPLIDALPPLHMCATQTLAS